MCYKYLYKYIRRPSEPGAVYKCCSCFKLNCILSVLGGMHSRTINHQRITAKFGEAYFSIYFSRALFKDTGSTQG